MKLLGLKYGASAGLLAGLMMTTAFYCGIATKNNQYLTLGTLLLMYSSTLFPIMHTKKLLGGEIEFKNAFKIGLSSGIFCALIFTLCTLIYYSILNPNYSYKHLVDIEISLKQSGLSGVALKHDMDLWREDMSVRNQVTKTMIAMSIFNTVLSAINALILCKKD